MRKRFLITSILFKISESSLESGWQSNLYIRGRSGRGESDSFTASPMAGYIWLHGLYKQQSVHISPAAWQALIKSAKFEINEKIPVGLHAQIKAKCLESAIDRTLAAAERERLAANKLRAEHGKPLIEDDPYFRDHLSVIQLQN